MSYAIAIDGPSGAGKSTIARRLADDMHLLYIDTGALYRSVGFAMLLRGIDAADHDAVVSHLPELTVQFSHIGGLQHVFVNDSDVTELIRKPEVSMAASAVSAYPEVRRFLLDLQREIAAENIVIMDGRDIGTVVLPEADVKIFLYATVEDRAQRRFEELLQKGQSVTYDEVLSDMKTRDYNDSHRAVAPLKPAEDAICVDTTGNTLEESVTLLRSIVEAHKTWD